MLLNFELKMSWAIQGRYGTFLRQRPWEIADCRLAVISSVIVSQLVGFSGSSRLCFSWPSRLVAREMGPTFATLSLSRSSFWSHDALLGPISLT